jgi:hypothetical protein
MELFVNPNPHRGKTKTDHIIGCRNADDSVEGSGLPIGIYSGGRKEYFRQCFILYPPLGENKTNILRLPRRLNLCIRGLKTPYYMGVFLSF